MLVMGLGQAVEGQRLFNVGFDPITQLRVTAAPFQQPGGQVAARFLQVAPVIEPSQFGQTVVVGLTGRMVQSIAKKMYIATLPGRFA